MDETVAVIGTGNMGAAMVARLRAHGRPVTVFNRTGSRAAALAARTGAEVATSARAAAASARVVVVSLADDAAVAATYEGTDGLVAGLRPGAVVAETSTVSPETVRALAGPVAAAGATLLDAPVSGSVPVVERGEVTVLAGGDAAALDTARPVLAAFASRVLHLGPLGSGATMKLVVNGVVHSLNQAVSEALVLAERAGVDRRAAYEVFAASAVAAPFVHYKRAAFEDPDGTPVAFRLDLVAKDLALLEALAAANGARMDQADTNRRLVGEALAAGYADRDISAMAAFLRST
ncbi:NAD(P)-dependent oxidoreductase [Virgisporangium aurantiacum]|uniref:3-hydroxyisobutyrate dehydrogenase n=1 Tax=Virgisporangium aurantiacum TaxID=175570 RepID=A0A8J3Z2Y6_9ACTN|nr:NAD(P)-dependent oxidoreductase [Virgisporangium aurantiacum]GIJ55353.1 3-hydroxyisobutyrate dehydrogenase [Virgisporangium aurantiacum]